VTIELRFCFVFVKFYAAVVNNSRGNKDALAGASRNRSEARTRLRPAGLELRARRYNYRDNAANHRCFTTENTKDTEVITEDNKENKDFSNEWFSWFPSLSSVQI